MITHLDLLETVQSWLRPVDWEAIFAAELPRVYNYFRYRGFSDPAAEDLTAAVFEKAWRNPEPWEMPIVLTVGRRTSGAPMNGIVGQGSVEEVQVNGQPAGLVHGSWNSNDRRWDSPEQLTLNWQRGDLSYQLQVTEAQVGLADLLRMAESIP